MKKYKEVNGTSYHIETPMEVINILTGIIYDVTNTDDPFDPIN